MNKRNNLLMIGLILGATIQINAMSRTPVTLESELKASIVVQFTDPKTNKSKSVVLSNGKSYSVGTYGDLMARELFIAEGDSFKQIEGWRKPIAHWYSEHYGEASSMIIVFAENKMIVCQFFGPNNKFLGGVELGHF